MLFNKVAQVTTKEVGIKREYIVWAQDGTSVVTERLTSDGLHLKSQYDVPLRLTTTDDPYVVAVGHEVLDAQGDLMVIHHQAVIFSDGRPGQGVVFNGGMIIEVVDTRY